MEQSARKLKNILTGVLVFLLLLAGLFLLQGYFKGYFRSEDTFRAYLTSFGLLAPLILVLIQALQVVLPVLPGFLGCIVGAGMFGAAGGLVQLHWNQRWLYCCVFLGSILWGRAGQANGPHGEVSKVDSMGEHQEKLYAGAVFSNLATPGAR